MEKRRVNTWPLMRVVGEAVCKPLIIKQQKEMGAEQGICSGNKEKAATKYLVFIKYPLIKNGSNG